MKIWSYLGLSRASDYNGLIVQLQNLPKALITVFEAMSEDHRGNDVTHCNGYDVVGIKWSSFQFKW